MPLNERGDAVCINHPESVMKNQSFVQLPHIMIGADEGGNREILHLNTGLPAMVRFCSKCGYLEMYTIKEENKKPQA
ncbi:hypothetical protein J8J42_12800 [Chryseobacterium sp. cx-311]|uniref:hypothetical protein n=1 Tax=Marnyiella aurantia TaxID=2758037 RepID=UPI001AE42AA8|nr:hypothetical protein [Marnyiella aurantia]MBP0613917.1 hypothetical protein [Marnyiella aurantia]